MIAARGQPLVQRGEEGGRHGQPQRHGQGVGAAGPQFDRVFFGANQDLTPVQ